MSLVLERIKENAQCNPERVFYAVPSRKEDGNLEINRLSWGRLWEESEKFAGYLCSILKTKTPVVVLGHKSPLMPVSFLACVKSGRAYVPVDISYPEKRIRDIISSVDPELIIQTEPLPFAFDGRDTLDPENIEEICSSDYVATDGMSWIKDKDTYYIIFTSGSTGKPKGVQITSECLDNFVRWAATLGGFMEDGRHHTFINHAPFSFDLSVFDLYLSLYTGGTLWAVPRFVQQNMGMYYDYISRSNADVWVSTPSSAEIALGDGRFGSSLLPGMRLFLFCGETLTVQTSEKLSSAFPDAGIINTYGPTESTVAVTSVSVDEDILSRYNPLPIGVSKPGTFIYIMDQDGNILPEGEKGEIVIAGDTVSPGYWKDHEKTASVFGRMDINGKECRLYHTHDKGYYQDGLLFYCGRIDLQIKLHGFRIELEDIESNILKIQGVERVVILPDEKDGQVVSLTAYVVLHDVPESRLKERKRIREALKARIPEYMVPKNYVFCDSLPVTVNGKVDRKKLEEQRNVQS